VIVIKSTFVVRFKSSKTRQETASQAATIHSANRCRALEETEE